MSRKSITNHGQRRGRRKPKAAMTQISKTKRFALLVLMVPAFVLGACTTQDAASPPPETQRIVTSTPTQRSYLDAGPAPARLSGPSYSRDAGASFAGRSDSFGNSVLPSF